jgi:hypothetical protein
LETVKTSELYSYNYGMFCLDVVCFVDEKYVQYIGVSIGLHHWVEGKVTQCTKT